MSDQRGSTYEQQREQWRKLEAELQRYKRLAARVQDALALQAQKERTFSRAIGRRY